MGIVILFAAALLVILLAGTAMLVLRLAYPPRRTYASALAHGLPTDPGALGLKFTERHFTLTDGSRTPAWVIEGGDPAGPTVVVSHGFGDSRYGSLLCAPVLAPRARRLVLYDLRGQGESTARTSKLGTAEPDDLIAVLDQLDPPEFGGAPVVLFGYSMGGGISIVAAVKDSARGRVVGVITEGPYSRWDEPIVCFLRMCRYPPYPFLWLAYVWGLLWLPGLGQFDREAWARRLPCPLLVLHGAHDPICPHDAGVRIAKAAPHGELVSFEQGGHLDLAECDAARYLAAMERFLAGIAVSR